MNGSRIPDTYKLVLLAGNGMPADKKTNDNHFTLPQKPILLSRFTIRCILRDHGGPERRLSSTL